MERISPTLNGLLDVLVEHLDIPKSLYEKAAARHKSLGEWLKRESSAVRHCDPDVRPQGSFRYGTVIRPLHAEDEYDLDNVCVLKTLCKADMTQQQLKDLYGKENKAYAREHGMLAPVQEKDRCWRLRYADEVSFHLDTLPCFPEDLAIIQQLQQVGVAADLANLAVAITDRRHPQYEEITPAWPSSNPRGFATWFERRAALGRRRSVREGQLRATVEDVPPYEWKTTLQRSIQVLKRHRDVMFRRTPDLAPISMIITNLAARAYEGESDISVALGNILARMPDLVHPVRPRVPNPADPAEDYADKWASDARLEKSFWQWHAAARADLARLTRLLGASGLPGDVEKTFEVGLTEEEQRHLGGGKPNGVPAIVKAAPALVIPSAAKPWSTHG